MNRDDLIGAWKLVSFESRDDTGKVTYPAGKNATGYLFYTADGHMSATITPGDRAAFSGGDLYRGTQDEWVQAARRVVAYCGRYELLADRVLHHVEVSLFPNWIGGTQERFIAHEGDRITLSTPPILVNGAMRSSALVWQRAEQEQTA